MHNNDDGTTEYHVVFSTGCSFYQDWQSYVFFYQAMASQQPGTVTRIVSGCNDDDEKTLRDIFNEQIHPMTPDGRFKIHFTPDYSTVKSPSRPFVYFNKPFGMRHWLEHALGYPGHPVNDDAIVILMDPDQLIMRPFTDNDFANTEWRFLSDNETPQTRIRHGEPMGQLYGFGLQWKDKVNVTYVFPDGPPSPVNELARKQAQKGYIVGPPYIATAKDMYTIVRRWSDIVVRVHDQYPHLLAEMFAYCLAAAHEQLPHQTASSFMISDAGAGRLEGWSYIDKMPAEKVCGGFSVEEVPNVLHFCQRYAVGKFFFGKRKLPKDFLSCESPLLLEPPQDLAVRYGNFGIMPNGNRKEWAEEHTKRHAFVLCYVIPALNAAATYYKQHHCDTATANFRKELFFSQIPQQTPLKIPGRKLYAFSRRKNDDRQ
jgi:hypothetical protein